MQRVSFFARIFGRHSAVAPPTPFEAGVAALERGGFDAALAFFARALAEARNDAERARVHNKRALTYLARGDRPAAIDAFVAALSADGSCVAALVNVGNLLLEDGLLDDAIVHYEAALRIDDTYALGHRNLGIAYKRLGRRADAVRAFRRADTLAARRRVHRA